MRREPSPAQPLILDDGPCPKCRRPGNRACDVCHGWAKACVVVGPVDPLIPPAVRDLPLVADLAARGSWPMGRGGWMTSETAACVQAVRLWWRLESFWKAKLGITGDE